MSNVHIRTIEDADWNLVEINYWHHYCALDEAPEIQKTISEYPAPEALDYPVYCYACGERIESVPLTDYGRDVELIDGAIALYRETVQNDS
jgi:hypothetical protein